jgi:MATE family multidrug resistance protein
MQPWAFISFAFDGFAYAAQSLVGRFIGAKDLNSLKRCIRYLFVWCVGLSLVFTTFYLFTGEWILAGFTDKEEVVLEALKYWPWVAYGAFLSSFAYIWDGIYIGATATRSIRNAMLICAVLFFSSYWILIDELGNHGLWAAITVLMIARGLILTLMAPTKIFQRL